MARVHEVWQPSKLNHLFKSRSESSMCLNMIHVCLFYGLQSSMFAVRQWMLVNIPHIIHYMFFFPKIFNELTKMNYCFLQSKDSKHRMSSSDVGEGQGGLRVRRNWAYPEGTSEQMLKQILTLCPWKMREVHYLWMVNEVECSTYQDFYSRWSLNLRPRPFLFFVTQTLLSFSFCNNQTKAELKYTTVCVR